MLPCGTPSIQGQLPHSKVDLSSPDPSILEGSRKAPTHFSVFLDPWTSSANLLEAAERGISSSLQPLLGQRCCRGWAEPGEEEAWGSEAHRDRDTCSAWLGTAWLPVTSDSVHYFWFSKGRKIRDTNLHTPLRRTIKRAEDILERLQMLLCPAPSTAGCLQNMLHVLLAYAPVLIYRLTLMSYHMAMTTQFKQNFQKSEPATPLCHLPLLTFVPALLRSLNADDTTPWGFVNSLLTAELSSIKWQCHRTAGARGTWWQWPHRETCAPFPHGSGATTLFLLWLFLVHSLFHVANTCLWVLPLFSAQERGGTGHKYHYCCYIHNNIIPGGNWSTETNSKHQCQQQEPLTSMNSSSHFKSWAFKSKQDFQGVH